MRPTNVLTLALLVVLSNTSTGHANTLCPTPFQQRNTCQAGRCSQTVYTTSCSISENETHTCADLGQTVSCCGGQLPTLSLYPCGIQSTSIPTIDMLADRFGRTRVFVLTCSGGYLRLGARWHDMAH